MDRYVKNGDWDFSEAYEHSGGGRVEAVTDSVVKVLSAIGAVCFFGVVWNVTQNPPLASWLLVGGVVCAGVVGVTEWVMER